MADWTQRKSVTATADQKIEGVKTNMNSRKQVVMAEGLQFTCPVCGWTVMSPKGEDDIMKHVDMHGKDYHADMPMTEDQIRSATKKVSMASPMSQKM